MSATFSTANLLARQHGKQLSRRFDAAPLTGFDALDPQGSECDCCGLQGTLAQVTVHGIETFACEQCRGVEPDLSEHEHALDQIARASTAVYAATLAMDVLSSTDRIAHAGRLIADAYRLIEDAEGLVRMDDRGEPT